MIITDDSKIVTDGIFCSQLGIFGIIICAIVAVIDNFKSLEY